jgi:hypothetical protein
MKRGLRVVMWGSLFIAAFLLTGLAVQLLWNWLVPELFNGPLINYYQAFGLLILSRILFKGFFGGHGGCGRGGWGRHYAWKEKWGNMSEEEREKFKQKMRERCGWAKPD